ncbi:hypothetical protein Tco_0014497 [Tanacetum coccineum]
MKSKKASPKGKDGVYRFFHSQPNRKRHLADEKKGKQTHLLMAVPKDHLRRFHGMDDAKEIWAAIKTRFGGKLRAKGMIEFQKLLSQLDLLFVAGVSDEDVKTQFLRSLPPGGGGPWDSQP